MKQSTALDILKTGENVFLTGSAGSGKTHTLNRYIQYLRSKNITVAITASTGIAATHMNGMTVHSWSGIGIKDEMTEEQIKKLASNAFLKNRIEATSVLIIDEISMLHAKQLELINQVLKQVKKTSEAFGGIQVVLSGDFFQLPPIGSEKESNREKFAFMSSAWLEAKFRICYLTEQHRQASIEATNDTSYHDKNTLTLDDILNQIRQNHVSPAAYQALVNTLHQQIDTNRTRLYTHNINVNQINENELNKLTTKSHTFFASEQGEPKMVEMLKKNVRTVDELTLKIDAKVMFIKNNNEMGVSNGTMGRVVDFFTEPNQGSVLPVVQLNSGRQVVVEPTSWVIENEKDDIIASYHQLPLCLAWAMTIHKSQGMTLEAAEIDLSKTFELGQGYVALSRLKSLSGLKLLGINEMSLQLDALARAADKRFKELSDEAEQAYGMLDEHSLKNIHESFVFKVGGVNQEKKTTKPSDSKTSTNEQTSQTHVTNESSLEQTKRLILEGQSIEQISKQRGLAQATIIRHISELLKINGNEHLLEDLQYLKPDEEVLNQVQSACMAIKKTNRREYFDDEGYHKLKPIYEYLEESIPYNTIRLALVFLPVTP